MKLDNNKIVWTLGHSTYSVDDFLKILKSFKIEQILDVRRHPGSLNFPQFNKKALETSLVENKIAYIHLEILGGRRKTHSNSKNTIWRHPSFRGYADYMETQEFEDGMKELKNLSLKNRSAIMCSEAVWLSCHRSMISDVLKADHWKVLHIMALNKKTEHPYTKPAKIIEGKLSYDKKNN